MTLEGGATEDRDLFDWFQDVAITSSGLGLTDVNYKRNLDVVQQDRDGVTLRRWSLSRADRVRGTRVGQRERRKRHRAGHAHVRLLRAGAVTAGCRPAPVGAFLLPLRPPGGDLAFTKTA